MDGGLSPRMRGNPGLGRDGRDGIRSIPAYAGEPHDVIAVKYAHRVYPRVCGGTR